MKVALIPVLIVAGALALVSCKKEDRTAAGSAPAASGAPSEAPAAPPVEGDLVITATLKDISGPFPANDIYNYAFVMRYEVGQVHKGAFAEKEILVGHYNPRMAREEVKDDQDSKVGGNLKSFQVGDAHYLVLSPLDGQWNGAVEDDYSKDRSPRWWALWADKAR